MTQSKKTRIKYKAYSFRLNEDTKQRLDKIMEKDKRSWNILFKELLDIYENKTMSHKEL